MDAGSRSVRPPGRIAAALLLVAAPLLCHAAGDPVARSAMPTAAAPTAPTAPLAPTAPVAPDPALLATADAAYRRKDYAAAADAYDALIAGGARADGTYYDAACSNALAGRADHAFDLLHRAIAAGFDSEWTLNNDTDIASLRGDPRWAGVVADFARAHPELPLQHLMEDQAKPSAARYFPVRQAIADGLVPPAADKSSFLQFYSTMAMFAGDYDTATERYLVSPRRHGDPIAQGYDLGVPAVAEVLARAQGRRAVFLNESHGMPATRASNFSLLAPLRKAGFQYLAMETLYPKARAAGTGGCAGAVDALDPGLAHRGYPTLGDARHQTGYYFEEPVYGQLLREALRLGFRIVPYESVTMETAASREQDEANSLACLFKADPKARLVVLAGFGHISKQADFSIPGGVMAYRFKQATGIDPLSVDSTTLLKLDVSRLRLAPGKRAAPGEALVLRNAAGQDYGDDRYDLMLYVPLEGRRDGGAPGWLTLGGLRKPSFVPASRCAGRLPCLVEARIPGELPEAVPSDRCVIGDATQAGCTLYLRRGRYIIGTQDAKQVAIGQQDLRLR